MWPSFARPAAGAADVEVFDVSGRRVASLLDVPRATAGTHEALWNGRGEGGERVPAGVYLVRLRALGRTLTRRVALLP